MKKPANWPVYSPDGAGEKSRTLFSAAKSFLPRRPAQFLGSAGGGQAQQRC
jgi:hypothetical protein